MAGTASGSIQAGAARDTQLSTIKTPVDPRRIPSTLPIRDGSTRPFGQSAGAPLWRQPGPRTQRQSAGVKWAWQVPQARGYGPFASCRRQRIVAKRRSYCVVLSKPDGYWAFMYRGEICFVCMAIISYAKSSSESLPITLWAVPPAFFARSPRLGTLNTGVGDPLKGQLRVTGTALSPRHPPPPPGHIPQKNSGQTWSFKFTATNCINGTVVQPLESSRKIGLGFVTILELCDPPPPLGISEPPYGR